MPRFTVLLLTTLIFITTNAYAIDNNHIPRYLEDKLAEHEWSLIWDLDVVYAMPEINKDFNMDSLGVTLLATLPRVVVLNSYACEENKVFVVTFSKESVRKCTPFRTGLEALN